MVVSNRLSLTATVFLTVFLVIELKTVRRVYTHPKQHARAGFWVETFALRHGKREDV